MEGKGMRKVIVTLFKGVLQSNVFIALGAVLWAYSVFTINSGSTDFPAYLVVLFLSTLVVYNMPYLQYEHSENPWVSKKLGAINVLGFNKALYLVVLPGVGLFFSLFTLSNTVLVALLPVSFLVAWYSISGWKFLGIKRGLREIPYLKLFVIAMVWALATTTVPAAATGNIYDAGTILIACKRLLFILAITIPFDVRDMDEDSFAGIKTIPQRLNLKQAKVFSLACISGFFILTLLEASWGNDVLKALPSLIAGCYVVFLLANKHMKEHPLYYYFFLDGAIVLHGFLLICFELVKG